MKRARAEGSCPHINVEISAVNFGNILLQHASRGLTRASHACCACGQTIVHLYTATMDVDSSGRSFFRGCACGSSLLVDLARSELYCCSCHDYVYHPIFDQGRQLLHVARRYIDRGLSPRLPEHDPGLNHLERAKRARSALNDLADLRAATEVAAATADGRASEVAPDGFPAGLRGLNNLGNTCFVNSVLQVFIHSPLMRNYFLGQGHLHRNCARPGGGAKDSPGPCLCCEMDAVFAAAYSGDRAPMSPTDFLYSWWSFADSLAGYRQQDAHEFYLSALSGLSSALISPEAPPPRTSSPNPHRPHPKHPLPRSPADMSPTECSPTDMSPRPTAPHSPQQQPRQQSQHPAAVSSTGGVGSPAGGPVEMAAGGAPAAAAVAAADSLYVKKEAGEMCSSPGLMTHCRPARLGAEGTGGESESAADLSEGGGPSTLSPQSVQAASLSLSLVDAVFGGVLRSDVTCCVCGHTSTAYDPFLDISLDMVPTGLPAPPPPPSTHGFPAGSRLVPPVAAATALSPPLAVEPSTANLDEDDVEALRGAAAAAAAARPSASTCGGQSSVSAFSRSTPSHSHSHSPSVSGVSASVIATDGKQEEEEGEQGEGEGEGEAKDTEELPRGPRRGRGTQTPASPSAGSDSVPEGGIDTEDRRRSRRVLVIDMVAEPYEQRSYQDGISASDDSCGAGPRPRPVGRPNSASPSSAIDPHFTTGTGRGIGIRIPPTAEARSSEPAAPTAAAASARGVAAPSILGGSGEAPAVDSADVAVAMAVAVAVDGTASDSVAAAESAAEGGGGGQTVPPVAATAVAVMAVATCEGSPTYPRTDEDCITSFRRVMGVTLIKSTPPLPREGEVYDLTDVTTPPGESPSLAGGEEMLAAATHAMAGSQAGDGEDVEGGHTQPLQPLSSLSPTGGGKAVEGEPLQPQSHAPCGSRRGSRGRGRGRGRGGAGGGGGVFRGGAGGRGCGSIPQMGTHGANAAQMLDPKLTRRDAAAAAVAGSQAAAAAAAAAGTSTLHGCLRQFVTPECLSAGEAWTCPACRRRQPAVKQLSIRRVPPVLALHVKRFEHRHHSNHHHHHHHHNHMQQHSQQLLHQDQSDNRPDVQFRHNEQQQQQEQAENETAGQGQAQVTADGVSGFGGLTASAAVAPDVVGVAGLGPGAGVHAAAAAGLAGSGRHAARKIQTQLQFPILLDLTPYTTPTILRDRYGMRERPPPPPSAAGEEEPAVVRGFTTGTATAAAFKLEDGGGGCSSYAFDAAAPSCRYQLLAVITHKGDLSGGHYVVFVRPGGGCGGCWYQCDDAWVTAVSEEDVTSCQAYMLFYTADTPSHNIT